MFVLNNRYLTEPKEIVCVKRKLALSLARNVSYKCGGKLRTESYSNKQRKIPLN